MNFSDNQLINKLRSKDQRDIAIALSDIMIEQQQNTNVKQALEKLRDIAWNVSRVPAPTNSSYEKDDERKARQRKETNEIIDSVTNPEEKKLLAESFVRLGHLYEIAGHQARHNFMKERRIALKKHFDEKPTVAPDKSLLSPGGIHELLFHGTLKNENMGQVISDLNTPISEYIFTQHPTNTNTLEAMKRQRILSNTLNDLAAKHADSAGTPVDAAKEIATLRTKMAEFAAPDMPIVSLKNFTAKDETDIVVNFLSNAFHDIKRAYHVTEQALSDKFGADYSMEQRKALDLKFRFGSWGSAGDKDGNNNIKSENTLEAILLHKAKAAELILGNLREVSVPEGSALAAWKQTLADAQKAYQAQIESIETKRNGGNHIPLTNEEFTAISETTQAIDTQLANAGGQQGLVDAISQAIDTATPDDKEKLLMTKRRVSTFGLTLGKIEYRETAEVYGGVLVKLFETVNVADAIGTEASKYTHAAKMLAEEHKKSSPDSGMIEKAEHLQQTALTAILSDDNKRSAFIALAQEKMRSLPGEHQKDYKQADALVYHTLRRMELARDFGGMITHNVLAECKGTTNLLEALAMQVAMTNAQGKRALLNIVPLFEEAETMAKIPEVLHEGLENAAYKAHIDQLKEHYGDPERVQQVQIAHSDNARRAGAIASRGIIHDGHRQARKAIIEYNQKHPGEPVELEFFEGGSFSDSYRNGVRAATAMISDFGLGKRAKATYQGGDLLNYFNQSTSFERLGIRGLIRQLEVLKNGHQEEINEAREDKVVHALGNMQAQYNANIYEAPGNPIGRLLYELGYRDHIAEGNAGTRGGARVQNNDEEKSRAIDATAIRTIGFSESLQHENIHPTFMGAGKIRSAIEGELKEGILSAKDWNKLYQDSPAFRDAIDKLSYSIVNSDLKKMGEKIYWKVLHDKTLQQPQWAEKNRDLLSFATKELPKEYVEAGRLVYEAMTGEPFIDAKQFHSAQHAIDACQRGTIGDDGHMLDAADRMRHFIMSIEEMSHLKSLSNKHGFGEVARIFKDKAKSQMNEPAGYMGRLFHNAIDTVMHGRVFMADDPKYRAAYAEQERAQAQTRA